MKTELPILINYTGANRHDSINFLYAADAFGTHEFGITPTNICLDSVHDNISTYKLLDHWDMNALIVLNRRDGSSDDLPEDISLDRDAHPLCRAGLRMCKWGFGKNMQTHKFRCPLACGRIKECPCASECSKSTYGRTVHIQNDSDLRFHPRIPRDSEQYQSIYKKGLPAKGSITVF